MPLLPGADPYSHEGGRVGALLLHGFTGQPLSVKPWGQHLAAAGLSVEVPRLPGHGTRWQDLNLTTWHDWYAEADRAFTSLTATCDSVFVMGLSMGGSLALRLAEQRADQVAGLVLVNPAVHSERPDRFVLPLIRRVIPSFPGIVNDIKKEGADEGGYPRLPLKAAHSLTRLWSAVKADIAMVTSPLLLFRSTEDHVVEPSNAAWILANVASADTHEVLLPHSYHVATLDNDADMIFSGSVDFVRRIAPGA
ncbi:MAG: alpha/beta fold hydrolase [Actinobacteria bacterium]|uniref:Unannotated protein n=1 Tax=freshwater metagenome TaxID=449393 RepID=A0A6J7NPN3_9ZZZZ|nr:alpha/beta fold hydrolase [Actinomycetota bacterium]